MKSKKYSLYPSYTETGISWLGSLPSGWQFGPLKRVVDQNRRITYGIVQAGENVEEGVPYIRPVDMTDEKGVNRFSELLRTSASIAKSYERSKLLTGDIICSIGPSFGKVMLAPEELEGANLTQGTARVALSNKHNPRFYFWALRSSNVFQQWESSVGGATFRALNLGPLSETYVPIPPRDDQAAIANFLDHETAKIDRLIEKQQQLIELLREKRQAVISHAVTKGLDPNVKMKDSGVEWLGEVPEHWGVKRIGLLFIESNARASNDLELTYPVLSVSIHHGISDKELDEEELDRKVTRSEDRSLYKVVHSNNLAYNMMRAWQGGFGASKLSGLVSPAYVVCKPTTYLNSYYFELVLRTKSAVAELKRYSRGITDFRLRLYWDEFKNIRVPVPPANELNNILRRIEAINARYERLASVANRQIELLNERRVALISAVVTGKVDVRNWQANTQTAA